ncbi:hypothetical protein Tco_0818221 [Tanacetum coccineum]
MTRSTVKRLTKPLDETKRELRRLRRSTWRLHQNESLAMAGRNLFDDEASSSNNTETKPPTPLKTLREHSRPNSYGFQNPITLLTEQTGRIIDAHHILLIQGTCMFQGLRNEDPLYHVKYYLSIVDSIQADEATRDTSWLHFFHFSLKGKAAEWFNRIPPAQITRCPLSWDTEMDSGSHEADECGQNNPAEQVCLFGGDIYDDPSLPRESKTPKPKATTFAITTRSGVGTRGPPFLAPSKPTPANTEEAVKKEGPEGAEPSITHNEEPALWPFIFYQPSKSLNLPFPSRVKKRKKDDQDERLLSIFKQIHINLPFLEAMIHMPKGAKPFFTKERDVIDVHEGKLSLRVGSETFTFNIGKTMKSKHSRDDYLYCADHTAKLLEVLKNHKGAIAWSIMDIKGIDSSFYTYKILMEYEFKPSVQPQRRVNPNIKEVILKKGGMTVVKNEKGKLIPQRMCMTRSNIKELFSPFENPEQNFRSWKRLFDTPSLVELNSPEFDHISDIEEQSGDEVSETMTETMEQYMSKTRGDYGSGVTRPTINQDNHFELKGQILKELRDNTLSGSEHEDANEHIEKVLEIVELFHISKVTQDQIMLRSFPVSLTGAASR